MSRCTSETTSSPAVRAASASAMRGSSRARRAPESSRMSRDTTVVSSDLRKTARCGSAIGRASGYPPRQIRSAYCRRAICESPSPSSISIRSPPSTPCIEPPMSDASNPGASMPVASASENGASSTIPMRPASDSLKRGTVSRLVDPVSRNEPGARSASTTSLTARSRSSPPRCTSSIVTRLSSSQASHR